MGRLLHITLHKFLPYNLDPTNAIRYTYAHIAEVAELADARDSNSRARKGLWVRFPPSALKNASSVFCFKDVLTECGYNSIGR